MLGREQGSVAGRSAAHGILNLTAAAITAAVLLLGLVAVFGLWFTVLYFWFILLPGILGGLPAVLDMLSACWPFLAAIGLVLLSARSRRPRGSTPPGPDRMAWARGAIRSEVHAGVDRIQTEGVANQTRWD